MTPVLRNTILRIVRVSDQQISENGFEHLVLSTTYAYKSVVLKFKTILRTHFIEPQENPNTTATRNGLTL